MTAARWARHPLVVWLAAIVAPIGAGLLLIPGRGHLDSADDTLILVLVTVAIAFRRAPRHRRAVHAGVCRCPSTSS